MARLMISIFAFLLFGTELMGQPEREKAFVIKGIQDPIKSEFQLLDKKLFFTFTLPKTEGLASDDSSLTVHFRTHTLEGFKERDPRIVFDSRRIVFDSRLEEYQFEIGDLQKSAMGEIYVQYSPSEGFKAMHLFSFNFYALNADNYDPKKLLRVHSKDGAIRVDFVKHDESILMPIIVATIDGLPGKLPLNFKQRGKPFQVSFIDEKTASFKAYVTIFFDADRKDSKMRILQFNEENKRWVTLKTGLHDKGVNAMIDNLGFFVLAEGLR